MFPTILTIELILTEFEPPATDNSLKGGITPDKAAAVGLALTLSTVLLVSAFPVNAQAGWTATSTYAPTLQPGDNQLITVITSFNGSLDSPTAINGSMITPLGTSVNLSATSVTLSSGAPVTGVFQDLYHVPDELGTYYFSLNVYNGSAQVATAFGSFGVVTNYTSGISSLSAEVAANSKAISELQGNLTADNAATQSSISPLSADIGSLGSSISSLVASGFSSLSASVATANTNATNASYYALGALVVALIAVIVAAFGAIRKR